MEMMSPETLVHMISSTNDIVIMSDVAGALGNLAIDHPRQIFICNWTINCDEGNCCFIMNNIKGDTKPRMEYGVVDKILDLVLDTLVGCLVIQINVQRIQFQNTLQSTKEGVRYCESIDCHKNLQIITAAQELKIELVNELSVINLLVYI